MQSNNISKKERGKKELDEQPAISVKLRIIYSGSISYLIECGSEEWSVLWYGFGEWAFSLYRNL